MSLCYIHSHFIFFIPLGDPPDIDEEIIVQNLTKGNKRVKIGTTVYIFKGYNVTIDCNVTSGTLPINISWFLNGTALRFNDTPITISDATYGDVITCRANNYIGFDEESTTIYVEGNLHTVQASVLAMYICMYMQASVQLVEIICRVFVE